MKVPAKLVRCAIYTRKSSEEGLEQSFNSLHAQREACEAYVLSQKHEGWKVIATPYDDGGFSGGNMERPGLKQLLADIAAAKIDIVVVYKVDRLTRSLPDFARIVESFDGKGVSFVSVTQQFNTTSSMGRLTLNVLLSFAQFEREVTGERIRDKVAASKRKGMWMGGNIPLGYDLKDRSLVINEMEAATVRDIFATYLRLKSVFALQEELADRGVLSKYRVCKSGRVVGGNNFSRGTLYHLLSSPLYIGKVPHRDQVYDGLHEAIIDAKTWAATAEMLSTNAVNRITSRNLASGRPLLGLLVHEDGSRFSPAHATKKGRRYPYYVSRQSGVQTNGSVRRLPAVETEKAVVSTLRCFLADALRLTKLFPNLRVQQSRLLVSAARHKAELLNDASSKAAYRLVRDLISSVVVNDSGMSVVLCLPKLSLELLPDAVWNGTTDEELLTLPCPFVIKRRGSEVRLVIADDRYEAQAIPSLERVVARARDLAERISSGEFYTMSQLVDYSGNTKQYVRRILRLAALSPWNMALILDGRQPVALTVADLCDGFSTLWDEQTVQAVVRTTDRCHGHPA